MKLGINLLSVPALKAELLESVAIDEFSSIDILEVLLKCLM